MASLFRVKFYTGDYRFRIECANRDGVVCYLEHHFNSSENQLATYTCALITDTASPAAERWARAYCEAASGRLGTHLRNGIGIVRLTPQDRGYANIAGAAMPAMIVEPLFVSNEDHVRILRSEAGRSSLAEAVEESIRASFPAGGLVGLSVGHKFRTSKPSDRGAPTVGGGNEADFAEKVLLVAGQMIESSELLGRG